MSLRKLSLVAAFAAAVLGLSRAVVPAQGAPQQQLTPVIAVMDPLSVANVVDQPQLKIVGITKAAKSLEPQFERVKKRFQDEIDKKRDTLQAEGKKLASQRAILSPDAYAQRERALRQQFADLQNLYLIRRDQLLRSAGQAVGKIRTQMMKEVLVVAKERKINLVLPRETVLAAASSLDITDEVVKRVDKVIPSLKFELVKPAKAPPKQTEAPRHAAPVPRGLKLPSNQK